jgi:ankyrin repeat protein
MIWKKEGRDYTCTNTLTPGTVELAFHGDNDLQTLRVRRFGYSGVNLDVKPTDKEIGAELKLSKSVSSSLLVESDAPSDFKQLNEALKKEWENTLLTDPEAFRCAPFDLDSVRLIKNNETGAIELDVALELDRPFGGSAFRLASHTPNPQERNQKAGQVALDNGIAEVLGRFHRIAAKFPAVKDIVISGSYSMTQAYLATEKTSRQEIQTKLVLQLVPSSGGGQHLQAVPETKILTVTDENDVVKDREGERAITFVMPTAQIPDTLDKKAISDAVLAMGKISLDKSSDRSPKLPSSLETAVINGDAEKVRALLKGAPDLVFSKDEKGWTLLHKAAALGHKDVAELLIANKADVNAKTKVDDTTPLDLAVYKGYKEMVELLLSKGADVNARKPNGGTPLFIAVQEGHKDVAELLIANKADINAKTPSGGTALHYAAHDGHKDVAELLLAKGADVNAKDNGGVTPLYLAVSGDYKDVVELLLANGADVNAKANDGTTPLKVANYKGYRDVAELLRHASK